MQAFVSLHTEAPIAQIDHEVNYAGYKRLPIEFGEGFGDTPINLTFPVIEQDSPDVVTHIAVGAAETGQGEVFMRVHSMPYIPLLTQPERLDPAWWMKQGANPEQAAELVKTQGYIAPRICIANTAPVKLPDNLNPIARTAHQLVYSGLMTAADLHPKLYEAINDALHNAGVPVLKVTRGAAATMQGKMSQLRLGDWGNA
jgi:hypothetical protein